MPVDPQPKRAKSVTCKLGAAPSAKHGCATSSKDSVPARLPKKTGSMLGILYTFWGMGFLIFL